LFERGRTCGEKKKTGSHRKRERVGCVGGKLGTPSRRAGGRKKSREGKYFSTTEREERTIKHGGTTEIPVKPGVLIRKGKGSTSERGSPHQGGTRKRPKGKDRITRKEARMKVVLKKQGKAGRTAKGEGGTVQLCLEGKGPTVGKGAPPKKKILTCRRGGNCGRGKTACCLVMVGRVADSKTTVSVPCNF